MKRFVVMVYDVIIVLKINVEEEPSVYSGHLFSAVYLEQLRQVFPGLFLTTGIKTTEDEQFVKANNILFGVYYINTSEIPSELLRENFISSYMSRSPSLWLHNKLRLFHCSVYVINRRLYVRLWI